MEMTPIATVVGIGDVTSRPGYKVMNKYVPALVSEVIHMQPKSM